MCAREIKFRCWWDNRMHIVEEINFKRKRVDLLGADIISIEECILMQYTGLKDKNGKEIYEGDLVKCNPAYLKSDALRKVEWLEDDDYIRCGYTPLCDNFYDNGLSYEDFEVVGNIYENKELLEKGE